MRPCLACRHKPQAHQLHPIPLSLTGNAYFPPSSHSNLNFTIHQAAARLLRLGADARLRDGEGKTALEYAQARGHAACEIMLREVCWVGWGGAGIVVRIWDFGFWVGGGRVVDWTGLTSSVRRWTDGCAIAVIVWGFGTGLTWVMCLAHCEKTTRRSWSSWGTTTTTTTTTRRRRR